MAGLRPVKPLIINHVISGVDTEDTIVLPNNVVDLKIRARNPAHSFKIATVSGESASNFYTIDTGAPTLIGEDLFLISQSLFIQSPDVGAILEIIVYH